MSRPLPVGEATLGARRAQRARRARRALRWRMATVPVVAALVVGVSAAEVVRVSALRSLAGPRAPAAPGSEGTSGAAVTASPPAAAPADPRDPAADQLIAVAEAAVEAWGRFAGTGDLAQVAPHFVADGPQYRQFAAEAATRQAAAGGPPYVFVLREATVLPDEPAGDRIVRGTLELSRDGEPSQRYQWDLRLRRIADGSWRIWTVLDTPAP